MRIDLNQHQFYESLNILDGSFSPLKGFMTAHDLRGVCSTDMRLSCGEFFPLPVVLDIPDEVASLIQGDSESLELFYDNRKLCDLLIEDIFEINKEEVAQKVFKTISLEHPGVLYLKRMYRKCIGGKIKPITVLPLRKNYFSPDQTKTIFKEKGWNTIAGFQTRNIPHKAHEYLQRLALEMVDGLMIHPLVGWKKSGDYTQEAIEASYQVMIEGFYPTNRVLLNLLYTPMRYAGPREALLHALIRRNFGCTHFIVGRDHAGVKDFYGMYEAQNLALEYQDIIGIKILNLQGPYYCSKCTSIVTSRNCGHSEDYRYREDVSGTMIRSMLLNEEEIDTRYLRKEILESIKNLEIFVK